MKKLGIRMVCFLFGMMMGKFSYQGIFLLVIEKC